MNGSFTLKDRTREKYMFRNRLIIAIIMIIFLSFLLIYQFINLQIFQRQYYTTLSKKNQIDFSPIPPRRGLIFDRNGVLLADNIPAFSLMMTPNKKDEMQKTIAELSKIIKITPDDIENFNKQAKQHRRFEQIPLKLKLTEQDVASFSTNRYRFPDVSVQAALLRTYPLSNAMSSVLGYVGRINEYELQYVDTTNYAATNFIGKLGIEKYYEKELHGTVGYRQVETDASGQTVRILKNIPSVSGKNLYLTIDSRLQLAAQKALGQNHGAVIAIQPSTGQVLALVSNPSYDPNLFVNGISQKDFNRLQHDPAHPLYNRTLRGLYPPGSTIKPFIATEALNANITNTEFTLFDPGWYKLPNSSHVFHDWKPGGHGWVNISKAIIESCDTYFYDLAHKMGIDRIDDILGQFGFDKPTGIDMGEELAGNIPSPEWKMKNRGLPWYPADTILSGIGQTFMQVTPMQLATATATLANHGVRFRPQLLFATQADDEQIIYTHPITETPVVLKQDIYWETIINAMQNVITEGTGYSFGHPSYSVAAKTGTAQVVNSRENDNAADNIPIQLRNNSVFIAFAPIQNPKIAISVVIENSHDAIRISREIMDSYLLNPEQDIAHATTRPAQ
ncbi:MAG: penicillin-binding protein 2 [Gammaproteobacteria bacterium RIFCSPHIGHO2_02_FULL_42_13]|nr:MAG: penicillin-binding protein 2 [Gammaproteobacteria bacterium RIFCSPHIGHO2_02_FULL_42_13]OGT70863.1 MAG: penicillin-binding protein 2 [Gammaproteobacteria bacterium RIFCSPLOWO2_02_FULL_42_9]